MGVSSKGRIGPHLRSARKTRGLDLSEVAQETRIHRHYLEALERDAPPKDFPAPIYARAFLREYARHLGLDPEPLVDAYRSAHVEPEVGPIGPPMPIERPRSRRVASALAAGSVAVLLAIVVFGGDGERPLLPRPSPSAPSATPAQGPLPAPGLGNERPVALVLSLRVVERPCWVHVARNGRDLFRGLLQPGAERTFRDSRRLEFTLGDAGAVRLTLSGKRLGAPGQDGEVYRAAVVLRNGRVRVIPAT